MLHALSLFYFASLLFSALSIMAIIILSNREIILQALGLAERFVTPMPDRPLRSGGHARVVRMSRPAPVALRAAA
jgi:hypothetical protein